MAAAGRAEKTRRDIGQERKFHRAVEASDQLLKVLGSHGRRFSVPAEDMEAFGRQVAGVCWEEARQLLQAEGNMKATQDEVKQLRRQLSQANINAMKQLGLSGGTDAERAALEEKVTFYDPLAHVDWETRDLILTILCDKAEQLRGGTAPDSLIAALCEHVKSGRLEARRKAAQGSKTGGQDPAALLELLADSESLTREAEDRAKEAEEEALKAGEQAKEAKHQLQELRAQLAEADARAGSLEAQLLEDQNASKAREEELSESCSALRQELEAVRELLEEEQRLGAEVREQAAEMRLRLPAVEARGGVVADTGGPEDFVQPFARAAGRRPGAELEIEEGDTGGSGGSPSGLTAEGMPALGGTLGGAEGKERGTQTEAQGGSEERGTSTQLTGRELDEQAAEVKRLRLMLEEFQMKIKEMAEACRQRGIGDPVTEILEGIGLKDVLKKKTCFDRLYEDAQKRVERLELLREKVRRERRALTNASGDDEPEGKLEPSVLSIVEKSPLQGLRRAFRIDDLLLNPSLRKAAPKALSSPTSSAAPTSAGVSPIPDSIDSEVGTPSAAPPPPARSPPPPKPGPALPRCRAQGDWPPARRPLAASPAVRFRAPTRRLQPVSSLPAIGRRPTLIA